jgi:hypothetical protein
MPLSGIQLHASQGCWLSHHGFVREGRIGSLDQAERGSSPLRRGVERISVLKLNPNYPIVTLQ